MTKSEFLKRNRTTNAPHSFAMLPTRYLVSYEIPQEVCEKAGKPTEEGPRFWSAATLEQAEELKAKAENLGGLNVHIEEAEAKPMKLGEFISNYKATKGPHDFMHIFYTEKGRHETISLEWLSEAKRGLLMNADIERAEIYETEYTDFVFSGSEHSGKCNEWSAEINADQAMIALSIHPLLRKTKPAVEAKAAKPKPKVEKAKPRKSKKRFVL